MPRWHEALRRYRRLSLERDRGAEARNVLFVLCSEHSAAAAFVASCDPALVFQTLGGACHPSAESTRATVEYAILRQRVRHVVVCGHQGCRAVATHGGDSRRATQADVVSQCVGLREDPQIGPLLRRHRVALHPLWFDDGEGDVFACNFENERVELMDDEDMAELLTLFPPEPR